VRGEGLGCNPMTDAAQTEVMTNFVLDASNEILEVKLDATPLIHDMATYNATYVDVIRKFSAAGVSTLFTVSLGMNAGTAGDVEEFQKAVQAISPSLSDVAFGVTYDIEEPHVDQTGTKFPDAWKQTWSTIQSFTDTMKSSRGDKWIGWDIALPGSCVEACGGSFLYSSARALDSMYYFNAQRDYYKSGALPNVVGLVQKCAKGSCKVRLGFEFTDEVSNCLEYNSCRGSFIWGGGLKTGQGLTSWINSDLLPAMADAGISADALAIPPFYVEDLSGYIPFVQNVKDGALPCTDCTKDDSDSLCPASWASVASVNSTIASPR